MTRAGILRRVATLLPLPVLGAAIAWVLTFNPTDSTPDPGGPCPWHRLLGIDGPGCGGTRMFWYLLHGDLIDAARHHLAALVAVPFLLYGYAAWIALAWFGRQLPMPAPLTRARLIVGYLAAFALYSVVLRNLPWSPFSWFYVPDLTP
ncbi:DUF2752 domain-containing protein [Longispora sp. K20-0274]|uniref:DUF2752 domain-containing protein n=1 Tax=Longispora sp. K20-0274 TaxID=3088255 RepID=UPI00399A401B